MSLSYGRRLAYGRAGRRPFGPIRTYLPNGRGLRGSGNHPRSF